ncbi:hypothetical protein GLOIN_2v1634303 [Rhizophagus irregularis DAOM 181602=DAOM 197198]|uniref:Uncharacterized protein n=1 Tax=Rhizophagus irregularis (strain DAOM 181602 / DAOM 197198 / MUCL 43194) TaxID=747089 RepID=A0A2P4PTF7_RHIID|nr:hypothetical protein GLOIN_2v1634303 [Rhizophagus irregularis DAOM 181602=DAOM 197198]POG68672.1 hypothetical protein GLOIN_2v1634303 [Rhizophagus irregularis DAOM 181602=DAOM 197198]|eukprot:XP_025175538.1 hypothetical protein GLOIN_2v1634303 [Rhizophagus irregularis DAOM 181602=DAOM 197198]
MVKRLHQKIISSKHNPDVRWLQTKRVLGTESIVSSLHADLERSPPESIHNYSKHCWVAWWLV